MNSHLIENRHIRFFISSTFLDMQDERNYLMKRTFPRLRSLAAERDVALTEVDLRWGITEEESKSGKMVEICLREIENSIPFFIGIIGNRYGWVPQTKDLGSNVRERFAEVNGYVERRLSLTEMEMQFGVLSRHDDMHAYFYIKELEEESDNPEMLCRLKEEVRRSKYPSSTYSSLDDLSDQIEKAFISLLDSLFPNYHLTEIEKERIGQRSFMNQLCQNYIKDEKSFGVLDAWLETPENSHFVVTGVSGIGKSALVANWVKEKLSSPSCKYNIIYHFTGNGGSESTSEHITRTLFNEVTETYGWKNDASNNDLKLLFDRVSNEGNKPLLIVIDAINQIVDADDAKLLNWLPVPTMNIKILFSTLADDRTMEVFRNRNYPLFTLHPLDLERRSQLIKRYLKLYGKSLTENQVRRIVRGPQCENTLVLKNLLDELIKFGIYEKLDDRIESYLGSETIDDFYQAFLSSHEEEYGRDVVEMTLSVIAVSKHGLYEQEIVGITEIPPLAWSQIYFSFASQLISKKGILSFSHVYVREAIMHRYLDGKGNSDKYRRKIIAEFSGQDSPRIWEELLHQYYKLGDMYSLSATLQKVEILNYMVKTHPEEAALYLRTLEKAGADINKYREIIRDADDAYRAYGLFIGFFVQYLSAFDLGLALCEDYQDALKDRKCHLPREESLEKLYINIGTIHSKKANFKKALKAFSQAYAECINRYGKKHLYSRFILKLCQNEESLVYQSMGNLKMALYLGLKVLDYDLRNYGECSVRTAASFCNLGGTYEKRGEYLKAIEYGKKALDIRIGLLGENNLDTAISYNNVGLAFSKKGDYNQAIEYGEKALEIRMRLLGETHSLTADSFNNVALAYGEYGDTQRELEYMEKALEIKNQVYGSLHPDTLTLYANVGVVYGENGNIEKAIEYGEKALQLRLKYSPENQNSIAESLINLGSEYCEGGNYEKALEYGQRALEILMRNFGELNDKTAACLNHIGIIYGAKEDYGKELEYYLKALDIRRKVLGEKHPATIGSYENVIAVYEDLGEDQKAAEYYQKLLTQKGR